MDVYLLTDGQCATEGGAVYFERDSFASEISVLIRQSASCSVRASRLNTDQDSNP